MIELKTFCGRQEVKEWKKDGKVGSRRKTLFSIEQLCGDDDDGGVVVRTS